MNVFLLCGVGCSGKTELSKSLTVIMPEAVIVPSGAWKREIVDSIPELATGFDSWHDLDQTQTELLNNRFFNDLIERYEKEDEDKTLIVETHLVYRHDFAVSEEGKYDAKHEFVNVLNNTLLAAAAGILLLDTPFRVVVDRRERELSTTTQRYRLNSKQLELLTEERALEEMRASFAKGALGTPMLKIQSFCMKDLNGPTLPSVESLAKVAKEFMMALCHWSE